MSFKKLALPAALAFLLSACGKDEAPPATTAAPAPAAVAAPAKAAGPAQQLQEMSKALKNNDLAAIVKGALPPDQYKQMKAEYDKSRAEPVTEEQRKEFTDQLNKLTGPTAIDDLMAQIEPQLAEVKPQAQGMIMMGLGAAQSTLASEDDSKLTAEQKATLTAMMPEVQKWAMSTDFFDAAKIRQSLTLVSDAVKKSGITSLDDMRKLEFEQMLVKASAVFGAVKQSLALYGLDLNAMADSVKVEVLTEQGDSARVKTSMSFFGAPISTESDLVKIDGRWYGKDAIEAFEKELNEVEAGDAEKAAVGT